MSSKTFSRELDDWLDDQAGTAMPDYLADVLARTSQTTQRRTPALARLARRLPFAHMGRLRATDRSYTMQTSFNGATRSLAMPLAAALAVFVVVGGLLVAANSSRLNIGGPPAAVDPLPAPAFGRAVNGAVAYASAGDIYTADPVTGASRVLVGGPEADRDPQWSRDGTLLAFERRSEGASGSSIMVVNADGTGLRSITREPIALSLGEGAPAFSPDGTTVMFIASGHVHLARTDGSGVRELRPVVEQAVFRPPDGRQIALSSYGSLLIAEADGTGYEFVVRAETDVYAARPKWSPDGSQLAYAQWRPNSGDISARAYVMNVADGSTRLIDPTLDAAWDGLPVWSNDGSRVVTIRGYTPDYENVVAAIVPLDGGPAVESERGLALAAECCARIEWAPDDSAVLWTPMDGSAKPMQQLTIDAATGAVRPTLWASTSDPAWQRQAP